MTKMLPKSSAASAAISTKFSFRFFSQISKPLQGPLAPPSGSGRQFRDMSASPIATLAPPDAGAKPTTSPLNMSLSGRKQLTRSPSDSQAARSALESSATGSSEAAQVNALKQQLAEARRQISSLEAQQKYVPLEKGHSSKAQFCPTSPMMGADLIPQSRHTMMDDPHRTLLAHDARDHGTAPVQNVEFSPAPDILAARKLSISAAFCTSQGTQTDMALSTAEVPKAVTEHCTFADAAVGTDPWRPLSPAGLHTRKAGPTLPWGLPPEEKSDALADDKQTKAEQERRLSLIAQTPRKVLTDGVADSEAQTDEELLTELILHILRISAEGDDDGVSARNLRVLPFPGTTPIQQWPTLRTSLQKFLDESRQLEGLRRQCNLTKVEPLQGAPVRIVSRASCAPLGSAHRVDFPPCFEDPRNRPCSAARQDTPVLLYAPHRHTTDLAASPPFHAELVEYFAKQKQRRARRVASASTNRVTASPQTPNEAVEWVVGTNETSRALKSTSRPPTAPLIASRATSGVPQSRALRDVPRVLSSVRAATPDPTVRRAMPVVDPDAHALRRPPAIKVTTKSTRTHIAL